MAFLANNIDRAIVMTQYDLRGFAHSIGCRMPSPNPKSLYCITLNLVGFAVGLGGGEERPTDESYVSSEGSSFEDYLAMCKRLAEACDDSKKEAIQLIIKEIVKQADEMKAEVATGKRKPSGYLQPLEKGNLWGKVVLALAEAFGVN
jgi:hypothetical protein